MAHDLPQHPLAYMLTRDELEQWLEPFREADAAVEARNRRIAASMAKRRDAQPPGCNAPATEPS